MKKRTLLACLLSLLTSIFFLVHAEDNENIEFSSKYVTYRVISMEDMTCGVIGYRSPIPDTIVIPSYVEHEKMKFKVISIYHNETNAFPGDRPIILPETLKRIESRAFYSCPIESIVIPDSVEYIGPSAFMHCTSLKNVRFPKGLKVLEVDTFGECPFEDVNIVSAEIIESGAFWRCYQVKNLTLPDNLKYVPKKMFGDYQYQPSLDSLTILSAEWISDDAFLKVRPGDGSIISRLKFLSLPPNLKRIGDNAFFGCGDLTLVLPDSLRYIGENAFEYGKMTGTLRFPEGLSSDSIGAGAFRHTRFSSVEYPERWTCVPPGLFKNMESLDSVVLPEGVVNIGIDAFSGCTALRTISLPATLKSIGARAFKECGFSGLDLPTGITSIDAGTFEECRNLVAMTVPDGVSYISDNLFKSCTSLTSVSLPAALSSIGPSAFEGCRSIRSMHLPSTVDIIGSSAFSGCDLLSEIELSPSIRKLGNYVFSDCSRLNEISLPDSLRTIGVHAFSGTGITSLELPYGVSEIGESAFPNWPQFTELTSKNSVPPTAPYEMFNWLSYDNVRVIVPTESAGLYSDTYPWSEFANIEGKDLGTGIDTVVTDTDTGGIDFSRPYEVYTISGQKAGTSTEGLLPGIYILRQGNRTQKFQGGIR